MPPIIYPGGIQPDTPAGDVFMVLGPNGGDIMVEGGQVVMTPGFQTAALLALMGGNADDPGTGDKSASWWANTGQPPERQMRGLTGHLLETVPPTSGNLRRLQTAINADLAFLTQTGAASDVEGAAALPRKNEAELFGRIRADGREEEFFFAPNWKGQAEQFAGVDLAYSAGSHYAYWVDDNRDLFVDNYGRYFLFRR